MDIHTIRKDPIRVKNNQILRFKDDKVVDVILDLDESWKKLKWKEEQLRSVKNFLSQQFKSAPKDETIKLEEENLPKLILNLMEHRQSEKYKNMFTRDQLKVVVKHVSNIIDSELAKERTDTLFERDSLISQLGNILHSECVIDEDESNNKLMYEFTPDKNVTPDYPLLDHIDLFTKLKFVDVENGIKVAGNRGYFITGFGVRLNQAILKYALYFL